MGDIYSKSVAEIKQQLLAIPEIPHALHKNSMVRAHGLHSGGAKCRTCKHLTYKDCAKRYYKCALRGITSGSKTDHSTRWDACDKYEAQNADN